MDLSSSLNLASSTPLDKEDLRKARTVLQMLVDHVDSAEFRNPVDWEGLGLVDYPQIVEKPMDLTTVGRKMQQDEYSYTEEILDDLQLIWDNCKNYNQAGSWIYSVADKMDKYFKKLVKNYFTHVVVTTAPKTVAVVVPQEPVTPPPARPSRAASKKVDSRVYYEEEEERDRDRDRERTRMVEKLKRLNSENLGRIVEIIMENCPKACRFLEEESCQVNLERVDAVTLDEIRETLAEIRDTEDRMSKRLKV